MKHYMKSKHFIVKTIHYLGVTQISDSRHDSPKSLLSEWFVIFVSVIVAVEFSWFIDIFCLLEK
jgi:hypothetical protein